MFEANHEREQVNAQRNNPKQGDDTNVLANLVRRREKQD